MPEYLTVVAEIVAKQGMEDELRAALEALIAPTRGEDGCVQYDLHVSTTDPGHFLFYENWTSKEALDQHLASEHIAATMRATEDMLLEPIRIQTYSRIG